MADNLKKVSLSIPFLKNYYAQIVSEVLNVDKELKGVNRNISIEGNDLIVIFEGADYKHLRLSVNALLKNVMLATKTINIFSS